MGIVDSIKAAANAVVNFVSRNTNKSSSNSGYNKYASYDSKTKTVYSAAGNVKVGKPYTYTKKQIDFAMSTPLGDVTYGMDALFKGQFGKAAYYGFNLTPAGMLKKYAGKILMKIGVKNAPQVAAWLERVTKPLSEGISSSSVDVDEKSPLQKMLDMMDGNISNSNGFGGDFGFAGGKGKGGKKNKTYETTPSNNSEKGFKTPKSGSGKEKSTDTPNWAKQMKDNKPYINENGKQYAKRLMDAKYGKGNWEGKSGTGNDSTKHHEYSTLKKHGDRGYK